LQWAVLAGLGFGLAYAVFARGGIEARDWWMSGLLVGAAGLVVRRAAPVDRVCLLLMCGLVAVPAAQLIPVPVGVLDQVSPARAEMARLAGEAWAPVTVFAGATREHAIRLAVYAVTFFVVRELAWRLGPFAAVAPVVLIGVLEAVLGLAQVSGGAAGTLARGTYPNRNHFAGLLEMALPLTLAWAAAVMARGQTRFASPGRPAAAACVLLGCAAAMLAAVLYSLSRMGFIGALAGAGTTGLMLMLRPGRRWMAGAAAGVALAGMAAFVFLPSDPLILRFADIASSEEISKDTRSAIWGNTLSMVGVYAAAGCGLGGFEDAFARFQTAAPMNLVDFAHNDYLQVAAEAGVVGLALMLGLGGRLMWGLAAAMRREDAGRYAAAGCCGALVAIGLHGLTDFNLYIPANGMAAAWVGGAAASYLGSYAR
jgi:O-antigen ligase